jgi:Zn-dependent peptidase ImmA (M78 family)
MFSVDFGMDKLEIKRAICLIFELLKGKDDKDTMKYWEDLKEIVAKFRNDIDKHDRFMEDFCIEINKKKGE